MITYKGKKIADKGLVINLPYRMDRKYLSERVLKNNGFEGYEYIDGVMKCYERYEQYLERCYWDALALGDRLNN